MRQLLLRKTPLLGLLLAGSFTVIIAACSASDGGAASTGFDNVRPVPTATTTAPAPTEQPAAPPTPVVAPLATPAPSAPARDEHALPPGTEPTPLPPQPSATPGVAQDSGVDNGGYLDDPQDDPEEDAFDPRQFAPGRTCGDGPLLSALPIDTENVLYINPLGNLEPPSHTFPTSHMYFGLRAVQGADGEGPFGDGQTFPPHPVYAVADSQIATINVSNVTTSRSGREQSYVEYSLVLAVCDGLRISYGHVGPVSDRIAAAVADAPAARCNNYSTGGQSINFCSYPLGLDLAAGEQIGFNSGRGAALDVGAFDMTAQNVDFQHPELYSPEANGSVCLLDLYPDDQRAAMAGLLGDNSNLRTADPASICGELDYTVPGTLQGDWFSQLGSFTQEDRNIAFVFDEVKVDRPIISIGFVPGIKSSAFSFTPQSEGRVNRPFADVEAGAGAFCYQDFRDHWDNPGPATHLLVEVPEAGRLLVRAVDGADCGSGPWDIGTDATQFLR